MRTVVDFGHVWLTVDYHLKSSGDSQTDAWINKDGIKITHSAVSDQTYKCLNICLCLCYLMYNLSSKLSDFSEIIGNNGRVWLIFSNYTKVKKGEPKNFLKVSILHQIHVQECPSVSISTNGNQSRSFRIRSQDRNGSTLIILKTVTSRDPIFFRLIRQGLRFSSLKIDGNQMMVFSLSVKKVTTLYRFQIWYSSFF